MKNRSDSPAQRRIEQLERKMRKLQIFAVATVVPLIAALGVTAIGHVYASTVDQTGEHAKDANFDTITVKRINVVEPNGTRRLVISDKANMPGKGARLVSPAGIVFYDEKGHERGGIGVTPRHDGEQSMLVFDYNCGEAIGLVRQQNGKHTNAELAVMDPGDAGCADGPERIKVQTVDGKAQVVLNDPKGRARLRFVVSKKGNPVIEFLDASGKVTRKISPSGDASGA